MFELPMFAFVVVLSLLDELRRRASLDRHLEAVERRVRLLLLLICAGCLGVLAVFVLLVELGGRAAG